MAVEHVKRTGRGIAARRVELDLTQHQLAERLPETSIDGQRISKWERGVNQPTADNLEALARALDTTVAELVAGPPKERGATPNGPGPSQLDRIERKLDGLAERLDALSRATPQDAAAAADEILPPPARRPGESGEEAADPPAEGQA